MYCASQEIPFRLPGEQENVAISRVAPWRKVKWSLRSQHFVTPKGLIFLMKPEAKLMSTLGAVE